MMATWIWLEDVLRFGYRHPCIQCLRFHRRKCKWCLWFGEVKTRIYRVCPICRGKMHITMWDTLLALAYYSFTIIVVIPIVMGSHVVSQIGRLFKVWLLTLSLNYSADFPFSAYYPQTLGEGVALCYSTNFSHIWWSVREGEGIASVIREVFTGAVPCFAAFVVSS